MFYADTHRVTRDAQVIDKAVLKGVRPCRPEVPARLGFVDELWDMLHRCRDDTRNDRTCGPFAFAWTMSPRFKTSGYICLHCQRRTTSYRRRRSAPTWILCHLAPFSHTPGLTRHRPDSLSLHPRALSLRSNPPSPQSLRNFPQWVMTNYPNSLTSSASAPTLMLPDPTSS